MEILPGLGPGEVEGIVGVGVKTDDTRRVSVQIHSYNPYRTACGEAFLYGSYYFLKESFGKETRKKEGSA